MKLHHVPAPTGLLWVKQGARTFVRQPLALAGLFFMFILVVSVLSLTPWVGKWLALALLPAANLGLMAAAREADQGHFPMPTALASAFRSSPDRVKAMLVLGALYAVGSFGVMLLSDLLSGSNLLLGGAEITENSLQQPAIAQGLILNLVLYTPLGLLFWHAPALVHWHGISPFKSLFFSLLACWTNRAALLVFFLSWAGLFVATSFVLALLTMLLGGPEVMKALIFPVAMVLSAMFFASLYFSFRDSFLTDDGQPAA